MVEIKGPSSTGVATWVLLRPALLLEGPVLEETSNPWSVKGAKRKGWPGFLSPDRHFLLLSAIPTSAAKPGIRPDLSRPPGLSMQHSVAMTAASAAAPAQSWQKPSVAFPPSEQRGPGSQGRVDPGTATESHLTPE